MLNFLKKILKKNVYVKEYLRCKDIAVIHDQQVANSKQIEVEFYQEFNQFLETNSSQARFETSWKERYPLLNDKTSTVGFDRHYMYHTAWAARVLEKTKPNKHIDISSLLYFSALVSAFVPIEHYDFRIPELSLNNLVTGQANLSSLHFASNSIYSLSCMHTIEHIGLGRYGDMLDYNGDLKAINELKRVLAVGGNLLFVVPIGKAKIFFNAHRVYSYEQIIKYFSDFQLIEFALIKEADEGLILNATQEMADGESYGCGCFWFKK